MKTQFFFILAIGAVCFLTALSIHYERKAAILEAQNRVYVINNSFNDGEGNPVPDYIVRLMVNEHFVYLNSEDTAILNTFMRDRGFNQ